SNALQRSARGVFPELGWDRGSASFATLRLVHDAGRDVLELVDCSERLVAPVPLGIVPAWTYQGALALAMRLLDPWIDHTPVSAGADPVHRSRPEGAVRRVERDTHGPVVVGRRTWRLPTSTMPRLTGREGPAEFLLRVH